MKAKTLKNSTFSRVSWWSVLDSNQWPHRCERCALPTEPTDQSRFSRKTLLGNPSHSDQGQNKPSRINKLNLKTETNDYISVFAAKILATWNIISYDCWCVNIDFLVFIRVSRCLPPPSTRRESEIATFWTICALTRKYTQASSLTCTVQREKPDCH